MGLKPGHAAERLDLSARQIERLVISDIVSRARLPLAVLTLYRI